MIKKTYLLLFILLFSFTRICADEWNLYPSYHNTTHCEVVGKKVYILASGALFSYNTDDNEVMVYDKINTLSDIDIKFIAYSDYIKGLVIVYNNANIDILFDDETIYNISDFKNKILNKKTINGIDIFGKTAYLSTDFGVVVIDLEELQITDSYNTEYNTLCTYLYKDKIYTGTDEGIFRCDTSKNMLDKNNWEQLNYKFNTNALCVLNDELYFLTKSLGIYKYDLEKDTIIKTVGKSGGEYYTIYNKENEIVAPASDKVTIIDKSKKVTTYKTAGSKYILKKGEYFWNCKGYSGVYKCTIKNNTLTDIAEPVIPNSPIRNYCEFLKFTNENKLLVTGGNINYFDITFYDGTIMELDINTKKWTNFPEDAIKKTTGKRYQNVCSIDEDPNESGHYFASAFGTGIYEFRDGKFVNNYNFKNSKLESVIPNNDTNGYYIRVPYVEFDKDGNLWCVNTGVKDIVKVLKKDGTWVSLNYKEIEYYETMAQLLFDSRGWLWITSLQGTAGLFCAKQKNTTFDTSDDETNIWINKFTNQDGISYDIYQVHSIREDANGYIWVGTNTGLFVIDNPEEFFKTGIFKQIKVPRNDGTGLADYLLSGTYIKAIAVDGANRKWVGTIDNGIYLLSSDGLETIHHFTTENSPLPSNNIESIAVNERNGEVYIGTNKGIASFQSDATKPEESLKTSEIYAFPNPVRANYNGNISIIGLTGDCNVKIVDSAGYLINEGVSNGGMYTWDGRNIKGNKVSSGVYYVLLYDKNGKAGEVIKILVTR